MQETIRYYKKRLIKARGQLARTHINYLSKLQDPATTELLLDLLQTEDVRAADVPYLIRALGFTQDERTIEVTLPYLKSDNHKFVVASIQALTSLKAQSAVPQLLAMLETDNNNLGQKNANDKQTRDFAIFVALGEIGDARAIPTLAELLPQTDYTIRASRSLPMRRVPVCETIYASLLKIGTDEALKIAETWYEEREAQLKADAQKLLATINNGTIHKRDLNKQLLRLKYHMVDILEDIQHTKFLEHLYTLEVTLIRITRLVYDLPNGCSEKVVSFLFSCLDKGVPPQLIDRIFKILKHYDDERIVPFTLLYARDNQERGKTRTEIFNVLAKHKVSDAVDLIAAIMKKEGAKQQWFNFLAAIGNEQSINILRSYMTHDIHHVMAMTALAKLAKEDDTALDALASLVEHTNNQIRLNAIKSLGRVGERAVYVLIGILNRDDASIAQAIASLKRIQSPIAIPYLVSLLNQDTTPRLQSHVIKALENIGTEYALSIVNAWEDLQAISADT